jgi:hypothetical protein
MPVLPTLEVAAEAEPPPVVVAAELGPPDVVAPEPWCAAGAGDHLGRAARAHRFDHGRPPLVMPADGSGGRRRNPVELLLPLPAIFLIVAVERGICWSRQRR